ncbi:MAG TPA: phosphodiesterase [Burkholderiaceae bacterium]|nr:phosphodiesterase [Burkholderiaceae bacterium]
MILCQISDLHITKDRRLACGVVDTATMLERCVARILKLPQRPDAVIATGDLADAGQFEEYRLLRDLLAPLPMPLYLMPGNHDDRRLLRRVFADHVYLRQWEPFVQYVVEDFALRLVALDTVIPGEDGGTLCSQRLAWLEQTLARSNHPTVVALHHPPFATGIGFMDRISMANPTGLAAVIARHPQVQRLIAGHVHRPIQTLFAGTMACTCPSPAHQVVLDLSSEKAGSFVMEPPSFQLHVSTDAGVVTHAVYVDDFAGPYPFTAC